MNDDYFERHRFNDGLNLEEYVQYLLKLGKRSTDPEFKTLMGISARYKERVIKFAKDFLDREKSSIK